MNVALYFSLTIIKNKLHFLAFVDRETVGDSKFASFRDENIQLIYFKLQDGDTFIIFEILAMNSFWSLHTKIY